MMRMLFRLLLPTTTKPLPRNIEMALKIGTALLITFAATLVLVHAEIFFGAHV
jgi:hypothetical protein